MNKKMQHHTLKGKLTFHNICGNYKKDIKTTPVCREYQFTTINFQKKSWECRVCNTYSDTPTEHIIPQRKNEKRILKYTKHVNPRTGCYFLFHDTGRPKPTTPGKRKIAA
jgi:hypothetical protein